MSRASSSRDAAPTGSASRRRARPARASDVEEDPSAPAGVGVLSGDLESNLGVFTENLESTGDFTLGGYQWRFLWLGVVPSTSSILAPAGDSRLLGHMGIVAWAQPAGDDVAPSNLPLGVLARGDGTSLHVWAASHICRGFEDLRSRRFERTPAYVGLHYVLDVMAVTMRVWLGNAYPELGDSLRILLCVLQPHASAPAGYGDTDAALDIRDPDLCRWVTQSLRPFIEEEADRQPRVFFQQLRSATASATRELSAVLDQHACVAIRGLVHRGSGIGLLGPHVKLGGAQSDHHASPLEEGGLEEWPMLPSPVRVSYVVHEGVSMPSLYLGQAQRTQGGAPKKRARR